MGRKFKTLKNLINELSASGQEMHRTISGKHVPFGCKECIADIETRIGDAVERRDALPHRSDARSHYNGMLKVLRRDKRSAIKEAQKGMMNESALRLFIRKTLEEQVVGYSAPSKSDSDPGYETIGDTSVAAGTDDEDAAQQQHSQLSTDDEEDLRSQMSQLQQQRSDALSKGDTATADHTGVQMQRLQDILG